MLVSLSWSTYLRRELTHLFSPQPPCLLVVECKVPEDPVDVCYVQNFADKSFDPLFSVNTMVSQNEVLMLDVKEVSGNSSLHEVLPAYGVLASS